MNETEIITCFFGGMAIKQLSKIIWENWNANHKEKIAREEAKAKVERAIIAYNNRLYREGEEMK